MDDDDQKIFQFTETVAIPPLVTAIEEVVSGKLFGVTFVIILIDLTSTLKYSHNQRSYFLKCLKGQSLPSEELHTVFAP